MTYLTTLDFLNKLFFLESLYLIQELVLIMDWADESGKRRILRPLYPHRRDAQSTFLKHVPMSVS